VGDPAAPDRRIVRSNGIDLAVAEQGDGLAVVLCHGFPELAYSWRHQMPALAAAGYRAIAPDLRGYGGSSIPDDVAAYDIVNLTDDLTGLLDALGQERAVFVGHDWGAIVVWNLAVLAPERVRGVAGLSVPFVPRSPLPPTQLMRALAGDRFFYILYFQAVGPADQELAHDPRAAVARIMWSASGDAPREAIRRLPKEGTGYLDMLSDPPALPPWLSSQDVDVYATAFDRTGFTGGLNYYRNMDRNWELTEHVAGAKVTQPALFVVGERDPVLRMTPPQVMDGWLEDLRASVVVPGAGHWVQQERPDEVNAALLGFLSGLDRNPQGPSLESE
jgi:pimeloyl-ACP methyl ester carboxylesterase